ncbi:hypothetical protein [Catellatospora sp. NPDC049133]|uniref:hypothetical protein n=1 Tax=Catellatospora sp. NPDC049133 TaxID=3155499 RepID=UPI0033DC948C
MSSPLARAPWHSPMLRVFELIGRQVRALGVPHRARFTAASALPSYILGMGGNAADARAHQAHQPGTSRAASLGAVSAARAQLDPNEYAVTRRCSITMIGRSSSPASS